MHTYNTSPPVDELTRAQTELNQVKDIMVQNVEQILSRGERIELLVDKTDVMAGQATAFRRGARNVRRDMWWRNSRIMALSVIVALVNMLYHLTVPLLTRSLDFLMDHCCAVLRCRPESLRGKVLGAAGFHFVISEVPWPHFVSRGHSYHFPL